MNSMVAQLLEIEARLDEVAAGAFEAEAIPGMSADEIAELLTVAGRIVRRVEGVQVEAVAQVRSRSEGAVAEKMTTRFGCSSPTELVRMLSGTDSRTAARLVRAAKTVQRERNITTGGFLPAAFPALRDAVVDGTLGVAGLLAATDPIIAAQRRLSGEDRTLMDAELAALAHGQVDDAGEDATGDAPRPLPLPEDLSVFAKVMLAYLDPDGAEPTEQEALQNRFLRIGEAKNGVHRVSGGLLPEVAAQLQLLLDSVLNPRVEEVAAPGVETAERAEVSNGVRFAPSDEADPAFAHAPEDAGFVDTRTRAQKLHDAFAAIVKTTAETDLLPHLGGAAPTLVVTATADDLARAAETLAGAAEALAGARLADDQPDAAPGAGSGAGTGPSRPAPLPGWATLLNTGEQVPLTTALRTACGGGIQRILFDDNGRITSLGTSARIFTAHQRRAIMTRDGGCVIPGCTVPATWCEIHHVTEWSHGGPTRTDNGALLCWWHHRSLHLTEWTIRIHHGVPEVRGPAWWDPHQHWHRARSPHRRPWSTRRPRGAPTRAPARESGSRPSDP